MARHRHLSRAPIKEAIIDIQFADVEAVDRVASFGDNFAAARGVQPTQVWATQVSVRKEPAAAPLAEHSVEAIGSRVDVDGKVFQFRRGGFTVSQLPPYSRWEALRDAALPVWFDFAQHLQLQSINRIAVRYINTIELPLPIRDFEDFLTMAPRTPPELPQTLMQFLSRVVMMVGENLASVTQALEGHIVRDDSPLLPITIDIDVFRNGRWAASDGDSLRSILEGQREAKNTTFFALLTDKTVEMYE